MGWHTSQPQKGQWIVIDRSYRLMSMANYDPVQGWCINGRWLGHDAVIYWHEPPPYPDLQALGVKR
jgi:hypothetical protein